MRLSFPRPIRLPGLLLVCMSLGNLAAQQTAKLPDGLYAEIQTSKGKILARLEPDLTPMTVSNFVGLAEGTIANAAFDPARPFYDGSVFHRVVPGHVIQTGMPQSDRAKNPGYVFPNEIHARLSHNHAGVLNMANGGPNTSASQFCITLGDRSYLDGDFNVFGEVVEGMPIVMNIAKGDVVQTVRILRIGAQAQAFHPTTESFHSLVEAAEKRVAEHSEKKRLAEQAWIASQYPKAVRINGGVLTQTLVEGKKVEEENASPIRHLRYTGRELRYMGHVIGRDGPPLDVISFASGETGLPGFFDPPRIFTVEPGKTKLNPGLDAVVASMLPGEHRLVIVPAASGYGRAGLYPPEVQGQKRFVVSPDALLIYEIEMVERD